MKNFHNLLNTCSQTYIFDIYSREICPCEEETPWPGNFLLFSNHTLLIMNYICYHVMWSSIFHSLPVGPYQECLPSPLQTWQPPGQSLPGMPPLSPYKPDNLVVGPYQECLPSPTDSLLVGPYQECLPSPPTNLTASRSVLTRNASPLPPYKPDSLLVGPYQECLPTPHTNLIASWSVLTRNASPLPLTASWLVLTRNASPLPLQTW